MGELARTVAMQIAACPTVTMVSQDEVADDFIENEKRIQSMSEDLKGKPDQIVTGRVEKLLKTKILLDQPYIRDPDMTVDGLVKSYIAKLGENIKVARFVRFELGGGVPEEAEAEA